MSYERATQAQLYNEALEHLRMAKGAMQANDAQGLWLHTGEAMLHAQLLPKHQEREIVRLTSTLPKTEALGAYKVQTPAFNEQEAYSHLRAARGALSVGDLCGLATWKGEALQRASMLPEPGRSRLLAQINVLPDPHPDAVAVSCMSRWALGSNGAPQRTGGIPQHIGLAATVGVIAFIALAGRKEHAPRELSDKEAKRIGKRIGIDWSTAPFTPEDLRRGIEVEMEHGPGGPAGRHGDVTLGDLEVTAQIALAHLAEHPRYYDYLEAAEYRFEHGLEPNARKTVKLTASEQRAYDTAVSCIDDARIALEHGDTDVAADLLGPFNRAVFQLPPKARPQLKTAMFSLPWPRKGVAANGPADEAEWMIHESDVALAEAEDCYHDLDFDCALAKGREARELATNAMGRARGSAPWRRGRAERRAQAQYDKAHGFLWEVFYAKRPAGGFAR